MAISMIERHGSWYDIFDERGKKTKSVSESIGELMGHSSSFFVALKGSWYDLYDGQGKKYKSLSSNIGMFVSISGDTFVVRKGSWLDTYDRFGKKSAQEMHAKLILWPPIQNIRIGGHKNIE